MSNCEYEKNGHCTLNECMYGDFLFIDDSAFETGKYCTCDYVLPSKYIDEMIKEKIMDNVTEKIAEFEQALKNVHIDIWAFIELFNKWGNLSFEERGEVLKRKAYGR